MAIDLTANSLPRAGVPSWASAVLLILTGVGLLLINEPVLANKFETIGGGIAGSTNFKSDWLQGFLYVVGGISLLSATLAVVIPHSNPLFLNSANWKQSAVVLVVIALICFAVALLL